MATSNAQSGKSAKEQLLEFLEDKPEVYKEAFKWMALCRIGLPLSDMQEIKPFQNMGDAALIQTLKETGLVRIENDSENSGYKKVIVTKQGRDEIINLFHEGDQKRELKRLIKKLEAHLPPDEPSL